MAEHGDDSALRVNTRVSGEKKIRIPAPGRLEPGAPPLFWCRQVLPNRARRPHGTAPEIGRSGVACGDLADDAGGNWLLIYVKAARQC
jgi:hypothetical protein